MGIGSCNLGFFETYVPGVGRFTLALGGSNYISMWIIFTLTFTSLTLEP